MDLFKEVHALWNALSAAEPLDFAEDDAVVSLLWKTWRFDLAGRTPKLPRADPEVVFDILPGVEDAYNALPVNLKNGQSLLDFCRSRTTEHRGDSIWRCGSDSECNIRVVMLRGVQNPKSILVLGAFTHDQYIGYIKLLQRRWYTMNPSAYFFLDFP